MTKNHVRLDPTCLHLVKRSFADPELAKVPGKFGALLVGKKSFDLLDTSSLNPLGKKLRAGQVGFFQSISKYFVGSF
jgi:hypothetical protein